MKITNPPICHGNSNETVFQRALLSFIPNDSQKIQMAELLILNGAMLQPKHYRAIDSQDLKDKVITFVWNIKKRANEEVDSTLKAVIGKDEEGKEKLERGLAGIISDYLYSEPKPLAAAPVKPDDSKEE